MDVLKRLTKSLALLSVILSGSPSVMALAQDPSDACFKATKESNPNSLQICTQIAEQHKDNGRAIRLLADLYYFGKLGVAKDYQKAFTYYLKAAELGDKYAQFNVGHMYDRGQSVRRNQVKAMSWFKKAADQDFSSAQARLADYYMILAKMAGETNDASHKAYKEARSLYKKAMDQGHKQARLDYIELVKDGWGPISANPDKAATLYQKAAEEGVAKAQFYYANMLAKGWTGKEADMISAIYWYKKASDQGNSDAQNKLGLIYEEGKYVSRDYLQAAYLYKKAADQGNFYAQFNLGELYAYGKGVALNYKTAIYWLEKAAPHHQGASDRLKEIVFGKCKYVKNIHPTCK